MFVAALCFGVATGQTLQTSAQTAAKKAETNEMLCLLNLRTINVAQSTFWGGDQSKGFARTLKQLGPAGEGILDAEISKGRKGGYRFCLVPQKLAPNQPVKHYFVTASPMIRLTTNQMSFYTDETGVIRFTTEHRPAKRTDPPVE
jgi:hypothetical protein